MSGNHAHIFYPDIGWRATFSLTAGTTATGYSLTSMQDGSMSTTWKSATLTGANTIKIDLGSSQTVGGVCILGHNLYSAKNAGATYTDIVLTYSTDDISYTTIADSTLLTSDRITSDLPWLYAGVVTARYLKIALTDPAGARAYAPEIAQVFVSGSVLSLTEPTGLPWTPMDYKMASRTNGTDTGMGGPSLPGYVTNKVKVEIGKQGISNAFFDDSVKASAYPLAHAAPSFQHFVRSCWSLGCRFVYARAYNSGTPGLFVYYDLQSGAFQAGETVTGPSGVSYVIGQLGSLTQNPPNMVDYATGWNWVDGVVDEVLTGGTSGATALFVAFTAYSAAVAAQYGLSGVGGYQRQWIGAEVVRAGASAKLRTPFVESWRRKLDLSMEGTGEWCRR